MLAAQHELIQVAAESGALRRGADGGMPSKYAGEAGNLETAMAETGLRDSFLVTLEEEGDIALDSDTVHIVPAWKWFLAR